MASNIYKLKVGAILAMVLLAEEKEPRRKRNGLIWVRPWIARKVERSTYNQLVQAELVLEDESLYREFFRTDKHHFQFTADVTGPRITKQDTDITKITRKVIFLPES